MNHSALLSRLHELNAKLDSVLEFTRRDDEGPDTYAGTGAKIGAGIGAVSGGLSGAWLPEKAARANMFRYNNVLRRLAQGGAKVRIGGALIGAASGTVAPALIGAGIGALMKRRDERQ